MERQKTVILKVNSQDRELTIYTCFEDIKGDYCVFSGKNKKSLNFDWLRDPGKIEDRNSVELEYVPVLSVFSPDFKEYRKRLEKASAFPVGSSIWLVGRFVPGRKTWHGRAPDRIYACDIGKKEKFIRPDLLE